jgi:phosphoglycolate phosphatase-like HAD superfamily hydrolase
MVLAVSGTVAQAADPLPSWDDTAPKQAIIAFLEKVSTEGSPDYVPPAERIATFDNDGCLWSEQPMYFQAFFVFDRIKMLASLHPEWKDQEPFASVLRGDMKSALSGGEHALIEMAMATHAGMTTEEFETIVTDWITTARHPKTGHLYTEMVYQPMLELLSYLRANGFKTFIVSGGGIEFMRPWAEKVYGIPPEQIIGSSIKTQFEIRDGKPVLLRLPEMNFIDDKAGKPVGINMHIGRRPIAAFGNSDGDLQMMQWTAAGKGARFCLYVHHTDAEREWAYDRQSSIGKLDKGLDEAKAKGWTVVSMKDDWNRIFAFDWDKSKAVSGETKTSNAKPASEFGKLIGQWVRPDGGYILDIRSITQDGKIEMAYLNPQPINVSKAQATIKEGIIHLFIELRDRNYPGNYYTLAYDSPSDRFLGIYHHLGIGQDFDVYFIRQ